MFRKKTQIEEPKLGLVRGAKPVRKIKARTGRLTVPGWHKTFKGTLPLLRVESQVEADGLELLEADPDIVLMAAQPHALLYEEPQPDGSTIVRRYVPDVAVLRADGSFAVIDFKVERHARSAKWRAKAAMLEGFYDGDHGVAFLVITKEMLAVEPARGNARLLALHRKPHEREYWDLEAEIVLMAAMERRGLPATLGEIRALVSLPSTKPGVDRAFLALLNMVADGVLDFDRRRRIDDRVEIRWPDAYVGAFRADARRGDPNADAVVGDVPAADRRRDHFDPYDFGDAATAAAWGVA